MTEFVRVRHPDVADEAEVPAGALDAYAARGWEPISEPRSYSRLQDEETIRAQQQVTHQATARAEAEQAAGDTVEQVLDRVGEDPALAAEALRAENEKAQPRVTLVARLERIAGRSPRTSGSTETEE